MRRALERCALALCLVAVANLAPEPGLAQDELLYDVLFEARVVPTERAAHVAVRVSDPAGLLNQIQWRIDPERHREWSGDGEIETEGDLVRWRPPAGDSVLRYVFRIDHLRDQRSYDSRCAETWAIFRGDDLVPPARVRTEDGAHSRSRLRLRVPQGWSVAVPFERRPDGSYTVDRPERRFDRPTGWMAVGRLGVRRETIAGSRVAVAGPVGQKLRRLDLLALLRWTLPSLEDIVGELPERMVVVGAGDPMWRGGLSGPHSVFVHSARPLIEEDGTSPILHELMHSTLGIEPGAGGDWIVEGLAELYSLELLVRSRTTSRRRFELSLARLEEKGAGVRRLSVDRADATVTARAVTVLRALDAILREETQEEHSLDDVVRVLAERRSRVTATELRELAESIGGVDLQAFFRRHVGAPR
jgi:hypothetical protein